MTGFWLCARVDARASLARALAAATLGLGALGCGASGGSRVVLAPAPTTTTVSTAKYYLYVPSNATDDALFTFEINPTTGALTQRTTVSLGGDPVSVLAGTNQRLYVRTGTGANVLRTFAVARETGALTPISALTSASGLAMVFHPAGHSLYMTQTGSTSSIQHYIVDPTTGALTFDVTATTTNVGICSVARCLELSSDGAFIYQQTFGAGLRLEGRAISPTTGFFGSFVPGSGGGVVPLGLVALPGLLFAATTDGADDNYFVRFALGSTGTLASSTSFPSYFTSSGAGSSGPFASQDGNYIYAPAIDGSILGAYTTGGVPFTSGVSLTATNAIWSVTHPDLGFVYLGIGAGLIPPTVRGFRFEADGTLTEVPGSPYPAAGATNGTGNVFVRGIVKIP